MVGRSGLQVKLPKGGLPDLLRISIDLKDDEIVLLIRLLLKHVIEFQEGDLCLLTPFESGLLRKLETARQDAIKSLNKARKPSEERDASAQPSS